MPTRLYITNSTTPYTPATKHGAWDDSSAAVIQKLAIAPGGGAATSGVAETNSSTTWDVFLGRWVSDALVSDTTFTAGTDTWQAIVGALESNSAADMGFHYHIWVTVGDSDTERGSTSLVTDDIADTPAGAEEFPTTAAGQLFDNSTTKALTNTISALAGDRIVVEIGYRATNSSTVSRTGTINYGNTGSTNLSDTSTNVTTEPGWIMFSNFVSLPGATAEISVSDSITVTDKTSTTPFKIRYGSYDGTGSSLGITGVGFKPSAVFIHKTEANASSSYDLVFKTQDMGASDSYLFRADSAAITTGITSFDSDGFTVGTSAYLNVSGITCGYIAIQENPLDVNQPFWTPTYTGDGADGLAVTGSGFTPEFVAIQQNSAITGAHKFTGTTDTQMYFGGGDRTDLITSLDSNGFTVNNGSASGGNLVNISSVAHFGLVFKTISNKVKVGSYTGDGAGNKSISVGWKPDFVWLKRHASGVNPPLIRYASHADDTCCTMEGDSNLSNAIERFNSDGFEVGSDSGSNENTATYVYLAIQSDIKDVSVSDTVTLTEAVTISSADSPTDTITVTENVVVSLNSFISVNDSITATENVSLNVFFPISVKDFVFAIDSKLNATYDSNNITQVYGGTAGSGETNQQKAQSFIATGTSIAGFGIKTWKDGTPTDNLVLTLTSSLGGSSLGSVSVAAASVNAGSITTFTFSSPVAVTNGDTYYIQMSRDGARDTVNAFEVYFNFNTSHYSGGYMHRRDNNAWSDDSLTSDWHFTVNYSSSNQTQANVFFPIDKSDSVTVSEIPSKLKRLRPIYLIPGDNDGQIDLAIRVNEFIDVGEPFHEKNPDTADFVRVIEKVFIALENPDYTRAIDRAVRHLQGWYRDNTTGRITFSLRDPVVTEVYGTHRRPIGYKIDDAGGEGSSLHYYYTSKLDAETFAGANWLDPDNVYLIYTHASSTGQAIGTINQMAVMSIDDVFGAYSEYVNEEAWRWTGGQGHELGHTYGLPHPPASPGGPDDYALMYVGYLTYPKGKPYEFGNIKVYDRVVVSEPIHDITNFYKDHICVDEKVYVGIVPYLTTDDKATLTTSVFFSPDNMEVNSTISVSDSIAATESVTMLETSFVNVSDTITVTENISGTSALSLSVFDLITVTENVTLEETVSFSVSDSVTVTESNTNNVSVSVSVSDSITVTDAVVKYDDTIYVSEFVSLTVTVGAQMIDVNDSVTVTEFVKLELNSFVNVNDSVSVTESTSVSITSFVNVFDSVSVTEFADPENVYGVSVFDLITLTEFIDLENIYGVVVNDSVTVVEFIDLEDNLFVSVSDLVTVTENVSVAQVFTLSVFDLITITENVALLEISGVNVFDSVTITENVAFLVVCFINVNDTITVTDVVTNITVFEGTNPASVFDIITVSEDVKTSITSIISVFDSISVSEDVDTELVLATSVNDSVAIVESVSLLLVSRIDVSDAVSITENTSLSIISAISASELITLSENVANTLTSGVVVSDSITVSENIGIAQVHYVIVNDTATITENITFSFVYLVNVSDSVSVYERITQGAQTRWIDRTGQTSIWTETHREAPPVFVARPANLNLTVWDSVTITEVVMSAAPNVSDSITVTESTTLTVS